MDLKMIPDQKGFTRTNGRPLYHNLERIFRWGGVLVLLLHCMVATAQDIGDLTLPLRYSTHTYNVTMSNLNDDVVWNVYDSTATRERIDGGIDKPYSKTTDYLGGPQWISAGVAYFTINFTGNLVVGKLYRLAYREKSKDNCYIYEFLDFRIQSPIDVDIVQAVDQCPGSNLQYLEGSGFPATQTTIEYHVVLRNTDYNPVGNWYFNFVITVAGQGGASATIAVVDYYSSTYTPLTSSFSNSATIAVADKDVTFLVTINDVAGVRQRIDFALDGIEGAFSERDIDVITPVSGENETYHYIDAIPAASYIAALD